MKQLTSIARLSMRVAIAMLAIALVWIIIGIPVFVFPRVDEPHRVDAVLILGPINESNLALGKSLLDEGFADVLLLSTPTDRGRDACVHPQVACFTPDPSTTQGEAQELKRLASEAGWKSVIVVGSTPHISRARMLIER